MNALMYILGAAIIVCAVAIIACVSIQQGKSQGLGAMAGGSDSTDSYYAKNKNRGRDAILAKVTIVLSVVIVVCVLVLNIIAK